MIKTPPGGIWIETESGDLINVAQIHRLTVADSTVIAILPNQTAVGISSKIPIVKGSNDAAARESLHRLRDRLVHYGYVVKAEELR